MTDSIDPIQQLQKEIDDTNAAIASASQEVQTSKNALRLERQIDSPDQRHERSQRLSGRSARKPQAPHNERERRFDNAIVFEDPAPSRLDCHYLITARSPTNITQQTEPTLDEHVLMYEESFFSRTQISKSRSPRRPDLG